VADPEVSVITTVYNGERFIAESIDSVLAQEDVDLELVVVDDGSTDGTLRVLEAVDDPRVRVLSRPRQGRARALNEAVAHSRAPILAVHDADDLCLPGRFSHPLAHLAENPGVDLVGSASWVFIDANGRELGRRPSAATGDAEIRRLLRAHAAPFAHSSVTMRRQALERVGGYDEALLVDLDLDLYIRLADRGCLGTVPYALVATRRHPSQFFAGRQGQTRSLRRRAATRRAIDRRADATLGGAGSTTTTAAALREAGAWAYWWARRLTGPRPILPARVRRHLDRRWTGRPDRP
jgi:glycosyltransferase involved in cell wall biosynthesis